MFDVVVAIVVLVDVVAIRVVARPRLPAPRPLAKRTIVAKQNYNRRQARMKPLQDWVVGTHCIDHDLQTASKWGLKPCTWDDPKGALKGFHVACKCVKMPGVSLLQPSHSF